MSNIKLTKSELAALDLLIAEMSPAAATDQEAQQFTPTYVRVTAVTARITTPVMVRGLPTPVMVQGLPPVTAIMTRTATPVTVNEMTGRGGGLGDVVTDAPVASGLSLEQLIELRKAATSQE